MDESTDVGLVSREGAACVIDAGAPEIIRATGGDRLAFLHRLVTGDVTGTPVGAGTRALLLDLKGRIVSDMRVFVGAEDVRLMVASGQGALTAAALSKYAVMDDFAAMPLDGLETLAVHGPAAAARLSAAGVPVPSDFTGRPPWSHQDVERVGGGPVWLVRARALGSDGVWLLAAPGELAAVRERLAAAGIQRLSRQAAEVLRIESGEPAFGAEITGEHFPMEVGLDEAIDYTKGCYLGQEPIVRVRDRGHINWRLVGLRVEGEVVPAAGDTLESDIKPRAGRITSAGRLPPAPPVALALLHVSVPAGSEVRVRHGESVVRARVVGLAVAPPGRGQA